MSISSVRVRAIRNFLTLKARNALDRADVVIHDRLVTPEILELARREAMLIDVGKKGSAPRRRRPTSTR